MCLCREAENDVLGTRYDSKRDRYGKEPLALGDFHFAPFLHHRYKGERRDRDGRGMRGWPFRLMYVQFYLFDAGVHYSSLWGGLCT